MLLHNTGIQIMQVSKLITRLKCLEESSFSVASLQNLQLSFVCSLVCLCGCTLTQRSKSTLTHGRTQVRLKKSQSTYTSFTFTASDGEHSRNAQNSCDVAEE